LCSQLVPQRLGLDEVDERALAVDLDDRQPLAVALLEPRVARDVDLPEGDALGEQRRPRPLAEVAARRRVEDDPLYG
jgi:hypothetical protein